MNLARLHAYVDSDLCFAGYLFNKYQNGPDIKNLFSCSTQLRAKFQLLIKTKIQTTEEVSFSLSDVVFIMLINVKMPTIVGTLTFISRINFMLNWVEHGKVLKPQGLIIDLYSGLSLSYKNGSFLWTPTNPKHSLIQGLHCKVIALS